jgi:hypothetical protein
VIYGPPPTHFEPGVVEEAGRAGDAICAAVRDALPASLAALRQPVNKPASPRGTAWKGTPICWGPAHAARGHDFNQAAEMVLATVHVPLADVPRLLRANWLHIINLTAREMPRLASIGHASRLPD